MENLKKQQEAKESSEPELEVGDCDRGDANFEADETAQSEGEGDTEYEVETDITTETEKEEDEDTGKTDQ